MPGGDKLMSRFIRHGPPFVNLSQNRTRTLKRGVVRKRQKYYTIAEDLNTPIEALLSPPVVPLVTKHTNNSDHCQNDSAVFRSYDLVLSCEEPKALDVGRFGPVCSPQFAPYSRLKQAVWRPRLKITSRQ